MSMWQDRDMSLSSERHEGIVVNRVSGRANPAAIIDFVNANAASWGEADVIWDLSEAQLGNVSMADCSGVIQQTEEEVRFRKGRRAALISRQALHGALLELVSGIARLRGHPVELKAFSSYPEAKAWLRREA